jgi:hypothetical protein
LSVDDELDDVDEDVVELLSDLAAPDSVVELEPDDVLPLPASVELFFA